MSEREEIQLRRLESIWQSRQNAAGVTTLFLGVLTLGACLFFLSGPSGQLAGVMACLLALLIASCWRLLSSAAKVVEIRKRLNPSRAGSRFTPEIIEAEVVDPVEPRALLA
jgi:hypothetical protein